MFCVYKMLFSISIGIYKVGPPHDLLEVHSYGLFDY
jgi:hypothetical protein